MIKLFVRFIAILGGFWLFLEAIGFFFTDTWAQTIKSWNDGAGFWILLVGSGLLTFLSIKYADSFGVESIKKYAQSLVGEEHGEKFLKILAIHSRPEYLYKKLGKDPKKVKKVKGPSSRVEHKPEIITDIEPDGVIIQRVFSSVGRRVLLNTLDHASRSDLASAIREGWDIVHIDAVVGPNGGVFLEDGEISPQALRELLTGNRIHLLVLMDCDSLKVVSSANSAGVNALIAVTGSLPVIAAEKFVNGLHLGNPCSNRPLLNEETISTYLPSI